MKKIEEVCENESNKFLKFMKKLQKNKFKTKTLPLNLNQFLIHLAYLIGPHSEFHKCVMKIINHT